MTIIPNLSIGETRKINKVALLIDGENIPAKFAAKILRDAGNRGEISVKRVYGNSSLIPGWEKTAGVRLIHSGTGKNSANMLLAIQAVDLALTRQIGAFVIASSDGDFSHLAHYLGEHGIEVVGIGEAKAPDTFVKACYHFICVSDDPVKADATHTPEKILESDRVVNGYISKLIGENADQHGMEISRLGAKMGARHKIKIGERPEKNWREYLERQNSFQCDPRGAGARVRIN